MKKIKSILFVCLFLSSFLLPLYAKPLINDQKWIISGAGRTIYLLKIDGSDKEILFDKVADDSARIEVLTNSYNGKIILCKVISKTLFSYWLVDIDQNMQYPIIENLKVRPSNTIMSNDGKKVSFTTSEQKGIKIWLYDVPTKVLQEFGENIDDGIVRFVRFSYDGLYALYSKLTGTNRDYYTILCLRDFTKNRDYELTSRKDGDFDFGEFYMDGENILISRTLPEDDYNTLWDFNIRSKTFTFVSEISGEFISAVSISRDGNQIAICSYNPDKPGKNYFWTMHKEGAYNLTYINAIPAGMIGIRISHDGKYFLYSTENSPTYVANMDGSINEELADLIDLPNLKDAMWYNHPPFPPIVQVSANAKSNLVTWTPSMTGTYPIRGYKVYRSPFSNKKNVTLLATVLDTQNEYLDDTCDPLKNYYYLVRSFDMDQTESIPSNHALLDRTLPTIKITKPKTDTLTNQPIIQVEGYAQDLESGIGRVSLQQEIIRLDESGNFIVPYPLLEGKNKLVAVAVDRFGNESSDQVEVTLDSIAPNLTIDFPKNDTELMATDTYIRGTILDTGSGINLFTINDTPLKPENDGSFLFPAKIQPGANIFTFKAIDFADNSIEKVVQVKGVKKVIVLLTIGSNEIIVNDLPSTIDAPPFIDGPSGRTFIPARFVVEPIGGSIDFEEASQKITIVREKDKIELWIGKNIAIVNGIEKNIDLIDISLCPRIENSRTYLPLRFIAENIGFLVTWDPILYQIKLQFPKKDLN